MRKIPYGIQRFQDLRTENYLYVDKTSYLELLDLQASKYIAFLRPRRFGKSLFLSMMDSYYDINSADQFNSLFDGLYIHKHATANKNSFYILRFQFSGVTTENKDKMLITFNQLIYDSLTSFCTRYNLPVQVDWKEDPASMLNSFCTRIRAVLKAKIYVLIDEYDHFANELLGSNLSLFLAAVTGDGFIRRWYEILKDAAGFIIDRIFITGVSPITLDSFTSGFNIHTHLTLLGPFALMMGFTEKEVKNLLEQSGIEVDSEQLIPTLKAYYDGYRFSPDEDCPLYNPDMVLYYIHQVQLTGKAPRTLIDPNVATDYGKLERLFDLKNQRDDHMTILNSLINRNAVSALLTVQFSLEKEWSHDDFKSLLFYLGLVSIESTGLSDVFLAIPNYVIKELYFDFFAKLIAKNDIFKMDTSELRKALSSLALNGNIELFLNCIQPLLDTLSNRDFIQFDEKHIKLVMMSYIIMSRIYYVKSEADIQLLKRAGVPAKFEAVLELKYLKKSETNNAAIEAVVTEGKRQIQHYLQSEELKQCTHLKAWVLVLSGSEWVRVVEVGR